MIQAINKNKLKKQSKKAKYATDKKHDINQKTSGKVRQQR